MGSVSLAIAYAKPVTASSQTNWGGLLGADFTTKRSDRIAHHAVGNLLVVNLKLTRINLRSDLNQEKFIGCFIGFELFFDLRQFSGQANI